MKIESEDLVKELTTAPSSSVDISDTINEDSFEITLSVSIDEVHSKEEGGPIVDFDQITIDTTDEDSIRKILTSRNISTNSWSGKRHGMNYDGMTGVALDIDGDLTLDKALRVFADYNCIIHTSTSHQVEKNDITADRFRVILPFEPGSLRFTTAKECKKVYTKLLYEYPFIDPGCSDTARQFFPFTGTQETNFELHTIITGEYFDVDISDISDEEVTATYNGNGYEAKSWDGGLRPREELERILKFCPFVKWMDENIDNPKIEMHEPLRFALISNLCMYEGGREEIHRILSRDCRAGKYTVALVDDKIDRNQQFYNPYTYKTISKFGWSGIVPEKPKAPAGWGKCGTKKQSDSKYLGWYESYILNIDGTWDLTDLTTLKHELLPAFGELEIMCPVCEYDHAVVSTDCFGFVSMNCAGCNAALKESALYPDMFTYKNKLLRVERRSNKFISMEVLEEEHFRSDKDFKFAKKMIFNDPNRKFLNNNFLVQQMGNADYEVLDYEFDIPGNSLLYKFPAISVQKKDNAFIDQFLDTTFQQYSDFIKNWLAMYCYTNYIVLPILVLTSERSSGKGTFANMVGAIFPTLQGTWEGIKETFNDQYKCKLMVVDENANSDKPMQYTELKRITGNKIIRINEKYAPAYYVPNNINIIIATNDPKPVFLKAREEPKSENTNNFFIYKLPAVDPLMINEELGQQLQDRLGHYVRTKLRARYETLAVTRGTNNRYGLPTPITQLEKDLFAASPSTVEIEAEELARHLICELNIRDPYSKDGLDRIIFTAQEYKGDKYVKLEDIRRLISQLRFKGSANPKSYVSVLQDQGVLTYKPTHQGKVYYGYKILRDPAHYDTPVPADGKQHFE